MTATDSTYASGLAGLTTLFAHASFDYMLVIPP